MTANKARIPAKEAWGLHFTGSKAHLLSHSLTQCPVVQDPCCDNGCKQGEHAAHLGWSGDTTAVAMAVSTLPVRGERGHMQLHARRKPALIGHQYAIKQIASA